MIANNGGEKMRSLAWRRRRAGTEQPRELMPDGVVAFAGGGFEAGPIRDRGYAVPFLVHRWLLEHPFDVVHFNDCAGDGSFSLAAKALGVSRSALYRRLQRYGITAS